jgi:hypothetical protein
MTRADWSGLLVGRGGLALVALMPYPPSRDLSRRLAARAGALRATEGTGHARRAPDPLDDWDPQRAVADLQRPCLGR